MGYEWLRGCAGNPLILREKGHFDIGFHIVWWRGILVSISASFGILWAQNGRRSNAGALILVDLLVTNQAVRN